MNRNLDDEVLRAVGHVKVLVAAGDAMETIVYALAHRNLGALSKRFQGLLAAVKQGTSLEETLKDEVNRVRGKQKERGYSMLLGVLLMDGTEVDDRLDTITEELMAAGKDAATKHSNKAKFLSNLALTAMALGMLVPIPFWLWARFAEVGWIEPPWVTDAVCYGPLGVVITILLLLMIRRR